MNKFTITLIITLITLTMLACGLQSNIPVSMPDQPKSSTAPLPPIQTLVVLGSVHLRDNPDGLGVPSNVIRVLEIGEVVTSNAPCSNGWRYVRAGKQAGYVLCEWVE